MKKPNTSQLLFALFLVFASVAVQGQQEVFTKVIYDDEVGITAHALAKTSDHQFLICGERDYMPMVMKMDQSGNVSWIRQYDYDEGKFQSAWPTSDSGFLLAGTNYSSEFFVIKIDSSGDMLWSKVVHIDNVCFYKVSVQETYDHGTILSTIVSQSSQPGFSLVLKLDSLQELAWAKSYQIPDQHMKMQNLKQTADSGFISSGIFYTTSPYNTTAFFIAKLAADGEVSWSKTLVDLPYAFPQSYDISVSEDGFLFLNNAQMALIKTDLSGNFLWGKHSSFSLYSEGFYTNASPKLNTTSNGDYVFRGSYGMMKVDSGGNVIFSQVLSFYPIDVIEAEDGGFMALGNGPVQGVSKNELAYPHYGIIKTDSLGNSSDCVYQNYDNTSAINLEFEPSSITASPTEISFLISIPAITEPVVSEQSGCVDFIGAIQENQTEPGGISAYPNPSTGIFRIDLHDANKSEFESLEIFNLMCELVYETTDASIFEKGIDLQSQPNGIYYLKGAVGNSSVSGRVIILK